MLFTDVYAGEVGSLHDYSLYKRSELYQKICDHSIEFFDDNYLIGDLAYKLDTNLMVGFKNNGQLTRRQQNFNIVLNKARVSIENAFAKLKGRFRRLKFMETVRLDLVAQIIVSACILHNVCIMENDLLEDLMDMDNEIREEHHNNPHNHLDNDEELANNNAIRKREGILNNLPLLRNRN